MLEDDYMGMVNVSTFMYAMRERALMDKLDNLRVPANNGMIIDFYSPHDRMWISCAPMMNMTLTLIAMQDLKMKSSGQPWFCLTL